MIHSVECALITSFVSKTKDRFHEYNAEKVLAERLELVSKMKGMSGVEVIFPYETNDAELLKKLLKKQHLEVAAINVDVEPGVRSGEALGEIAGPCCT